MNTNKPNKFLTDRKLGFKTISTIVAVAHRARIKAPRRTNVPKKSIIAKHRASIKPKMKSYVDPDRDGINTPLYFYLGTSPGLERFRRIVSHVILWLRLYQDSSSQVREVLRFFTNSDIADVNIVTATDDTTSFSSSAFKASKQAKVPRHIIDLLKLFPHERSQSDVNTIEAGLRLYPVINDLPHAVTRQLAKTAWYQEFETLSIIIRESDWPIYYYFILSGTVVVSIIDREKMMGQIVATLTRGDTFGELSIIYGTRRTSTIIAKEQVGLLILTAEEYINIFLNGGERLSNDTFLATLACFHKFPIETLFNQPVNVKFSYFRRGEILVEDSKMSEWIFIIKSGQANVVIPIDKNLFYETADKVNSNKRLENHSVEDMSVLLQRTKLHSPSTEIRRRMRFHLRSIESLQGDLVRSDQLHLPVINPVRKVLASEMEQVGREDTFFNNNNEFYEQNGLTSNRSVQQNGRINQRKATIAFWTDDHTVRGKRTLATDLNKEYYQKKQLERFSGMEDLCKEEALITIQTLTTGNFFGLTNFLYENQPSVKLISCGCECYIINKSLYHANATPETLYLAGHELRPYPNIEDVVKRSQEGIYWKKTRRNAMQNALDRLAKEHVNIHDSRQTWTHGSIAYPI